MMAIIYSLLRIIYQGGTGGVPYCDIFSINPATFINTVHIANWNIVLLKILPSICDDDKSTRLLRSNCLKYSW